MWVCACVCAYMWVRVHDLHVRVHCGCAFVGIYCTHYLHVRLHLRAYVGARVREHAYVGMLVLACVSICVCTSELCWTPRRPLLLSQSVPGRYRGPATPAEGP